MASLDEKAAFVGTDSCAALASAQAEIVPGAGLVGSGYTRPARSISGLASGMVKLMSLKVVGAGVGRTGTNSLKLAEQLLGGKCHHMFEVISDPTVQIPLWTNAIEGGDVDWSTMPPGFVSLVDWPGASFWRDLSAANPDALVLLSVSEPLAY